MRQPVTLMECIEYVHRFMCKTPPPAQHLRDLVKYGKCMMQTGKTTFEETVELLDCMLFSRLTAQAKTELADLLKS